MVVNLINRAEWCVVVTMQTNQGSTVIGAPHGMTAIDAFDYAIQAQGYFRFAIGEMDCRSIEIDVRMPNGAAAEIIEITRD